MTPKIQLAIFLATAVMTAGTVQAAHNNPWAGEDDVVLEKFHDANQAKSIGTPGETEMRGVMGRNANGKLGGSDRSPSGQGTAREGAAGGHGGQSAGDGGGRNRP